MRVLVTGASGGLGRFLTERLIRQNGISDATGMEQLTLMARKTAGLPSGDRIRVVCGDLRDPAARASALEGGVDVVFHFAATLAAQAEREFDLGREVNIDASFALLNELRNARRPPRVVYPSSIGVYGEALSRPVDDETTPRPNIAYGAAKYVNEIYITELTRRGDIDGVSIRLPACLPRARMPDFDSLAGFRKQRFSRAEMRRAVHLPSHAECGNVVSLRPSLHGRRAARGAPAVVVLRNTPRVHAPGLGAEDRRACRWTARHPRAASPRSCLVGAGARS